MFLLVRKIIPSRIDISSGSFRSALIYLIVFTIVFLSFNIIYDIVAHRDEQMNETADAGNDEVIVIILFTTLIFGWVFCYPMFLLPTLRADTQFWRGIGKRRRSEQERNNQMQMSPLDINVASHGMKQMMEDVGDTLIDFAFVKTGKLIGSGSTAKVYKGVFRSHAVAIKVSTPSELNQDSLKDIAIETENMKRLSHPNICKFFGVIVKPPQISIVLELCSNGDLKTHLMNPSNANTYWTPSHRIRACLECCMAVAYLHHNDMIHRDIKMNNFFIDSIMKIKLGDFGESTLRRESEMNRNMTIVGTVSYMAPELISADRNYTFAIDIYALGITFWEIWTGGEAFTSISNTFTLYNMVQEGVRPEIPTGTPTELSNIMREAWSADPSQRPKAIELVSRLCEMLVFVATGANCEHDEEFSTTIAKAATNNDSSTTVYTPDTSRSGVVKKGLKVIETIGDKIGMFRDSTIEMWRDRDSGSGRLSNEGAKDIVVEIQGESRENEDGAKNPLHS